MIRLRLYHKIIGIILIALSVFSAAVLVVTQAFFKEALIRELQDKGLIITRSIVSHSIEPLLVGDFLSLKRIIEEEKSGDPHEGHKEFEYAFITDLQGKVLAHSFAENKFPVDLKKANVFLPNHDFNLRILAPMGNYLLFDFLVPIKAGNEVIGVARVGMSTRNVQKDVQKVIGAVIGITLIFLFITFILAFWITNLILGPVKLLKHAANEVGKGNLDCNVLVKSNDELQELGEAFKKMSDNLKIITVSRDKLAEEIAERRKAEEKLRVAYEQLRQTQFQLVQSSKMASLGVLAGGIAHEINNPLTGVLNNAQLIKMMVLQKDGLGQDEFNKILDEIEDSAKRCTKITSSLLEFSRSSKGKFEDLSLNEIAEKVFVITGKELKLQGINIQKEFALDLSLVNADSQLLQQVVFDTINNAKHAIQKKSGRAGGIITLKSYNMPEEKSVCLAISDTGTGISQKNIKRIFEPFFTTKPIGEGTGLGLAIITDIVKSHKGRVEVESVVGNGATFKIILPAVLNTK